jgi:hypothetical protein
LPASLRFRSRAPRSFATVDPPLIAALQRETLVAIDAKRGKMARVDFIREAIKQYLQRPSRGKK